MKVLVFTANHKHSPDAVEFAFTIDLEIAPENKAEIAAAIDTFLYRKFGDLTYESSDEIYDFDVAELDRILTKKEYTLGTSDSDKYLYPVSVSVFKIELGSLSALVSESV